MSENTIENDSYLFNENLSFHPLLAYGDAHPVRVLVTLSLLACLLGSTLILTRLPAPDQTSIWWEIALNLAQGKGYTFCDPTYFPFCGLGNQVTASREPVPVFLFAGLASLTGESRIAASLLQMLFHVGVIWGIFLLTREWASTRTALLATAGWALYPPALSLVPQVAGDLLAAAGVTVGTLFLLRARKRDRTWDWLLAGAGFGVGLMSRSAVLVVIAAVILGLVVERWRELWPPSAWLRPVFLISCCVGAMLFPWMVRNRITLGEPILGSSLTGYNLYRHNYMLGSADYLHYVGTEEGIGALQELLARRPDLRGTENEAQMDTFYRREALRIIHAHPVRYLHLSLFRLLPLWFNWKINESDGMPTTPVGYCVMVLQAGLLILSLVAVLRHPWRTWPLWSGVVLTTLAYMAVGSRLRYLVPVMPLVISLGTAGGVRLLHHLWARKPA